MTKKETRKVWKIPHGGGTLTLTQNELIEEYRDKTVVWSHEEFMEKTNDPDSLSYRMICSVFGRRLVKRIRMQIQRFFR